MKFLATFLIALCAQSVFAFKSITVITDTNGVLVAPLTPTNLWVANSNGINAVINFPAAEATDFSPLAGSNYVNFSQLSGSNYASFSQIGGSNYVSFTQLGGSNYASFTQIATSNFLSAPQFTNSIDHIFDGVTNSAISGSTTNYWLDMGRTNAYGYRARYHSTLTDVNFNIVGVTNAYKWGLISIDVVAGTAMTVTWPTNLFKVRTNGLTFVDTRYSVAVPAGQIFRATAHSNDAVRIEFLWQPATDR